MTPIEEMQKEYLKILAMLIFMIGVVVAFAGFSGFILYRLVVEMRQARPTYIVPAQKTPNVVEDKVMQTKIEQSWSGVASYYSEDGCIGCSPTLTMANGKRFDEDAMTLAFNRLPLGSRVTVTNGVTGSSIEAEVTDTGGFEKLGRIADLSKGLKEAIGCTNLCQVKIVKL
jgi:rare lipoprotein A (peptidoglycan hydrolase)